MNKTLGVTLHFCRLIHEDWIAHGKDWRKPGFRAVAVYRFGVWRMTIPWLVLRAPFSILYRMLFRFMRNFYGIELPYSVQLGRRVVIEHQHGIIVHGAAVIGDDCILRQGVTIGNRTLDKPHEAPIIEQGVNVGAGAKILGNITIGQGASIGANAVVLRDVPPKATAVGNPAVIHTRR
nr:serine O-acetyltransferase [uncultured Desulfobulbus sp.]